MRREDSSAVLDSGQAAAADTGIKAMIPVGRPFLDYVISALADAGILKVCLVIGPERQFDAVLGHYGALGSGRVNIEFAVQEKPRGTADAVASAEGFCGDDPFLVMNSDNYYPREALESLRNIGTPGMAAFERDAILSGSNIPPERIAGFAAVEASGGFLKRIIEKPDPETLRRLGAPLYLSMNCWRFHRSIFTACRSIGLSPRGELELPAAVQYSIESMGERYEVLPFRLPVLDLTGRGDITAVAERLAEVEVRL
jgi:glucose-1-phosphate thymidylyltransferase